MTREEFTFDSRDGASKIYAIKWIPEGEPKAILQITHGMAEHFERYAPFAEYLTSHSILVTADDHLGHGKTKDNNVNAKAGYICPEHSDTVMVRDEHRLKKTVQGQYPGVPYFVLGHSMGSFIIRNYLYRYGTGINGAIVMGTGMQPRGLLMVSRALAAIQGFFLGDKHESRFINNLAFGTYNRRIDNPANSSEWLTRDKDIQQAYIDDPNCGFTFTVNGFKTLFKLIWNLTVDTNINKMPMDLPILITSGEEDPVGNYGETVKQVYESFKTLGIKDLELKLYPECRHEILNELNKEEVYGDILSWIEKHI